MRQVLTKADWLAARGCVTQGWFQLREPSAAPTEAERFRMQQGFEVGLRARDLFPNGMFVGKKDGVVPAEVTHQLINMSEHDTFFEPTFVADPFIAKVDILRRDGTAWHVLEVKSSFPTSNRIEELVDDLTYTVFVLKRAGQQVAKASLVLLSHEFKLGQPMGQLFEIIDKTADVNERLVEIEPIADRMAASLLDTNRPKPRLISSCRECRFFTTKCIGYGLEHTVFEIPALHPKKLRLLSEGEIVDLSRVPDDLQLSDVQQRARCAALSGQVAVSTSLNKHLQGIQWPCHYLDFETVATVLPLYPGHGCHRQVLTQFSIHHRDGIDADLAHSEYLADASKDCEREVAEALLAALKNSGSIIVYSHFEKTRIEALIELFPDLAELLQAVVRRLCDLHTIVEDNAYHPKFRGSFSIKKVLPALVPGLSYADLRIGDGDTAIARFAAMANGGITGDAATRTREDLLEYCKRDTLAMVRLHEALHTLAKEQRSAPCAQ
ncbi:MAG: hypothetical protein QOG67_167 [Verrucomicrobiota bacterium]|jgi:hypothetical protein